MLIKSREIEKIKQVEEITKTNFFDEVIMGKEKGYVDCYTLYCMVEELLSAIDRIEHNKNEEIESLENKIQEMNDHNIY